mmetsp:Transcript_3749/g.23584  ORF Transcript_3749/g.23584 Transcript_3749/m.23584 type:complete len:217 (+) Transcript_3749:3618-4268(+)
MRQKLLSCNAPPDHSKRSQARQVLAAEQVFSSLLDRMHGQMPNKRSKLHLGHEPLHCEALDAHRMPRPELPLEPHPPDAWVTTGLCEQALQEQGSRHARQSHFELVRVYPPLLPPHHSPTSEISVSLSDPNLWRQTNAPLYHGPSILTIASLWQLPETQERYNLRTLPRALIPTPGFVLVGDAHHQTGGWSSYGHTSRMLLLREALLAQPFAPACG